jgi:hypothetical protein
LPTYSSSNDSFPILAIDSISSGPRSNLPSGFASVRPAGRAAQAARLDARFSALGDAMSNERLTISDTVAAHDPELVIVLEVNSTMTEFARAASAIPGLEFLAEIAEDPEEPEHGITTQRPGQLVDRTLYVLAQNAQALTQLRALWALWLSTEQPTFARGLAPWKQVFALLKDVRAWGPGDRIAGTQLQEVWTEALGRGEDSFVAEVELWFRRAPGARARAEAAVLTDLRLGGCEILDVVQIDEIAYHAVLVRVDASVAADTLREVGVLATNARVSLVRPQTIGADRLGESEVEGLPARAASPTAQLNPLVAVLDAIPLEAHQLLTGRLIVDDPDHVASRVQARDRLHGTAIASLVVWGDLENGRDDALGRKVYCHPLFTSATHVNGAFEETMPHDRLAVGVMYNILSRMFVGTDAVEPEAATVRVVVLAAGHTALPFGLRISPWARLLDVFASRFGVLFIVSAGNYPGPIELDPSIDASILLDQDQLQRVVRGHMLIHAHERRLLSPADSLNALTVGSLHTDAVRADVPESAIDVIGDPALPSPTSALGGGYLRAMKPDVFAPGGRVFYRHRFDRLDRVVLDVIESGDASPGLLAAVPGRVGETSAEGHLRGTSAAAALVGHEAAQTIELLKGDGALPALVPDRHLAIATKALLVNASSWMGAEGVVQEALGSSDRGQLRRDASRLLGFGAWRLQEVANCHERKITVVSTGSLVAEESRVIDLPIPADLNGRRDLRKVIATLAWFTPVNSRQKAYRQARVWLEIENDAAAGVVAAEGEWRSTRRGSIQHEVLVGDRAVAISDSSSLRARVNCMGAAGGPGRPVDFAVALTFEVADGSPVRVYSQIATQLRARAAVQGARARVRV